MGQGRSRRRDQDEIGMTEDADLIVYRFCSKHKAERNLLQQEK